MLIFFLAIDTQNIIRHIRHSPEIFEILAYSKIYSDSVP